jgi:O-antigen/teichoic acid export membrane protein
MARELLGEAAFTFTSRVGIALLTRLDALMSAKLLSPASTVVLVLTGRAVDVVRLGADRIGAAAMPAIANLAGRLGTMEARRAHGLVGAYAGLVLGVLAGTAVAWNATFVRLWVGEAHYGGLGLTVAIALYGCLASFMGTFAQSVFALGGIRETAVIALLEGGARLALQLLLVGALGLVGFPVAAAGALLLVSLPLLVRVAGRRFGTSPVVQAGILGRTALAMGALVLAGALLGHLVAGRGSWAVLLAGSTATGAAMLGAGLAIFQPVRDDARRAITAWRAR